MLVENAVVCTSSTLVARGPLTSQNPQQKSLIVLNATSDVPNDLVNQQSHIYIGCKHVPYQILRQKCFATVPTPLFCVIKSTST